MNDIFLTSDTHFCHGRICTMCNRPIPNLETMREIYTQIDGPKERTSELKAIVHEMNEIIIDNWNKVVKPKDTVYHMGDFTFRGKTLGFTSKDVKDIFGRLNGKKHLILGNHDDFDLMKTLKWESIKQYSVLKYNKERVVLFHYPILAHDGEYTGSRHAYGHIHTCPKRSIDRPNARSYDVGVDNNNLTPVVWDTFIKETSVEEYVSPTKV